MYREAFHQGYMHKLAANWRQKIQDLINQGWDPKAAHSEISRRGGTRAQSLRRKAEAYKPKSWFETVEGKRYLAETAENVDTDELGQLRNKQAADTTGLADYAGTGITDVDPDELRKGMTVELEHTKDSSLAKEIALDHLTESPDYYTKLETIEDR